MNKNAKAYPFSKKRLGQHFLISKKVLGEFLGAIKPSANDTILEVGAGLGSITFELAKKVRKVIAVEIDPQLCAILQEALKEAGLTKVKILNQDILRFHFNDIYYYKQSLKSSLRSNFSENGEEGCKQDQFKIVGAIPYQITSPLLHKILLLKIKPSLIVLIIQKEVAQKITARAPKASYLSNLVQCLGRAKIVGKPIKPRAFWPPPKVQSAILRIEIESSLSGLQGVNLENFCQFLHRGFSHPRKMLKKIFAETTLTRVGIQPTLRAENLTLAEWQRLFRVML